MPSQRTHVPVVRQWCQSLGVLSAVSITRHEADMKLAAYIPLLVDRFPDAAFTTASLEYVAFRASKGFPTYSELAEWLAQWWREHSPAPPRITGPDTSESARLERRSAALAIEWDDPAGIRRRIADLGDDPLLLGVLCSLVNRHAPQHLGWFPPAVIEAMQQDAPLPPQPPGDDHRPTPRYATPAQLDQLNPLPGGRKRDATTAAAPAVELRAAPVGADAPAGDADADTIPF